MSDASGTALAGAKITIENLATGVSRDTTTDKDGFDTAPNLLPGTYEITVSAPGFATQVRKGVTLSVGGQSTVNLAFPVDTNFLFDQSGNSLYVPGGDGAGTLHSTVTDSREVQFALKFV